jgi:hypothetical protein
MGMPCFDAHRPPVPCLPLTSWRAGGSGEKGVQSQTISSNLNCAKSSRVKQAAHRPGWTPNPWKLMRMLKLRLKIDHRHHRCHAVWLFNAVPRSNADWEEAPEWTRGGRKNQFFKGTQLAPVLIETLDGFKAE